MSQPMQRPGKEQGQATKGKEDPFAKFIAMLMNVVLLLNVATIATLYYWGKGDEVNCGASLSAAKQTCYLPGWDLSTLSIIAVVLSLFLIVAVGLWQKNK